MFKKILIISSFNDCWAEHNMNDNTDTKLALFYNIGRFYFEFFFFFKLKPIDTRTKNVCVLLVSYNNNNNNNNIIISCCFTNIYVQTNVWRLYAQWSFFFSFLFLLYYYCGRCRGNTRVQL